nr:LysR substrate-binding domain-containing protein [uncultured Salipiger sp.]
MHGEPCGPLEQADLGLRHAAKPRAGLALTPLVPETVIPVCSPDDLARQGPIDGPRGTAPHPLALLTGPMRVPWDVFLELTHHEGPRQGSRGEFSDYALPIQSAIKGQCVGLGWWHVVASQIEAGDLVPAGARILRSRDDYHLVMLGGEGQSREPVRRVQDWLLSEFRGLHRQLAAMGVEVLPF